MTRKRSEVQILQRPQKRRSRTISLMLLIGDCNRVTSFDLSTEENTRENTFHKLDRLISALEGLRNAIEILAAPRDKRRSVRVLLCSRL